MRVGREGRSSIPWLRGHSIDSSPSRSIRHGISPANARAVFTLTDRPPWPTTDLAAKICDYRLCRKETFERATLTAASDAEQTSGAAGRSAGCDAKETLERRGVKRRSGTNLLGSTDAVQAPHRSNRMLHYETARLT